MGVGEAPEIPATDICEFSFRFPTRHPECFFPQPEVL